MRRRVAVTGAGVVSCLGHDYEGVLHALRAGQSGVIAMPAWGERGLPPLAGAIVGFDDVLRTVRIPKALLAGMSDAARYCSVAALGAVTAAGLSEAELAAPSTACIVGSGVGGVRAMHEAGALYAADKLRRIDPYSVLKGMASSCSAAVANLLGVHGRSYSISSACATSAHNIGHAFELIRAGVVDRAVAGGGEDIDELLTASFAGLRGALSRRYDDPATASRPFDARRDGFVISGGAAILVLEELTCARARGAAIKAEITGFGASSDGFDLVLPRPDGAQAAACMRLALRDAGRTPDEVDYVNAHATATPPGDLAEAQAMRVVFGGRIPPISSTKSMTGHALGASGGLELVFCTGMLERGFLAPSINIDELDPAMADLPVVREPIARAPRVIVSNSFGFGGTNASVVLEAFRD